MARTTAVVGLLLVVTAQAAGAAQSGTLESRMPMNIAGPLGIIVAAIGLAGLLAGLWRLRRKTTKARRVEASAVERKVAEPAAAAKLEPVRTS